MFPSLIYLADCSTAVVRSRLVFTGATPATQASNGLIYTKPPLAPRGFFQGTRHPDF